MSKIAHEVRNPLTSIQTYIQLMKDKHADEDLDKFYISTVSQSINRLDSLIDKLVTFSSTQEYNFEKTDMNGFMEDAEGLIQSQIPDTHTFSMQAADKVIFINADSKQLVKAVCYLVMTIVDRTPDGAPVVMSADMIMEGKPFVALSLKYSGGETVDIAEQNLLKPLLDINHLGTELNIPLSHKIIDGHGGSLEIKSEGEMNTLTVKFPVVENRNAEIPIKGGLVSEQ
jgi:polar amino acid transport system substrate-binding protein